MRKLGGAADDAWRHVVTMSYYGADKVVNQYNIMGPVKAALEATVRYMAAELGDKGIRVFAVSPGPLRPARRVVSRISTNWSKRPCRGRRRIAWWISPRLAGWYRSWSAARPPA